MWETQILVKKLLEDWFLTCLFEIQGMLHGSEIPGQRNAMLQLYSQVPKFVWGVDFMPVLLLVSTIHLSCLSLFLGGHAIFFDFHL